MTVRSLLISRQSRASNSARSWGWWASTAMATSKGSGSASKTVVPEGGSRHALAICRR